MSWTCKQVTGQPHCLIVYLGTITEAGLSLPSSGGQRACYAAGCPRVWGRGVILLLTCNLQWSLPESWMKMTHLHQVSSVFNHCILIYSLLLLTWLWRSSIRLKKYRAKQYYSCIFDQSAATCETVLLQTHVGTSLVQKSQPTTAGDSQMDRKVSHVTQESGIKS